MSELEALPEWSSLVPSSPLIRSPRNHVTNHLQCFRALFGPNFKVCVGSCTHSEEQFFYTNGVSVVVVVLCIPAKLLCGPRPRTVNPIKVNIIARYKVPTISFHQLISKSRTLVWEVLLRFSHSFGSVVLRFSLFPYPEFVYLSR